MGDAEEGMLEEGTAVLDVQAAADVEAETPPTLGSPETEQPQSPETGDAPDTPETDEATDPFADLDETAIVESPRVKALLEARQKDAEARHNESLRRTKEQLEREQQDRVDAERSRITYQYAQEVQSGETFRQLERMVKDAVDEGRDIAPDVLRQATAKLQAFHSTKAIGDLHQSLNSQVLRYPNAELPEALNAEYARAYQRGDMASMATLGSQVLESVIRSDERAKALAEFEKDVADKAKQEQSADELRKTEAARKAQQGPTNLNGSPPRTGMTHTQLDAAYTSEQWRQMDPARKDELRSIADELAQRGKF